MECQGLPWTGFDPGTAAVLPPVAQISSILVIAPIL